MSKSPKQLPIFLKRAEVSFILIVYKCLFSHILTSTVTVSYRSFYVNQVPVKL